MSLERTEGSITVFLSCILLIVIVFTCTIIDTTRIRIAKLQALRVLRSASTSVLANYDSEIAHQYGVFTLEKETDKGLKNKIEDYANAALHPEENLPEMNLIYQILYPNNTNKQFKLYDYDLQVTSVIPTGAVVESDTDYIKLQILEYMKYRAPLLLIEPFLEKLQLVTKASKTSHYVNKKMELADRASDIEDYYRELEKFIDGLNISKKGAIRYEDFFVKGLLPVKGIQQSEYLTEIPDQNIKSVLQNKVYDVYKDVNNLYLYIDYFDQRKKTMVSTYRELYWIRVRIAQLLKEQSDLNSEISSLESKQSALSMALSLLQDSNEDTEADQEDSDNDEATKVSSNKKEIDASVKAIQEELSQVESSLTHANQQLSNVNSLLNQSQDEETRLKTTFSNLAKTVRSYIDSMNKWIDNINNLTFYLEKNRSALGVIEKIEKEGHTLKSSIEALEKDMEANKDALIESSRLSIEGELKALKVKLAVTDDQKKAYLLVNNLYAIKDELQKNIEALTQTLPYIEKLNNKKNNIMYHMLYRELNPYTDGEILQAFMLETDGAGKKFFQYQHRYKEHFKNYVEEDYTNIFQQSLNHIETLIEKKYATQNMVFNYGEMTTLSEEEKDKIDPRDEVKDHADSMTLNDEAPDVTKEVDRETLPSLSYVSNIISYIMPDQEVDFEEEKKDGFTHESLSAFSQIAESIKNTTINLRNELYINEYILGQFKSATDNLPDAMPTTLSHYSKEDHFLNNEVEYVLRGSLDENRNLNYVKHTILGIRFVMNYLHILTNSEKRTLVMGIASSIAGWWTFGLGIYIVAALIMAAWSYAESCADINYLLQGKRVAFLKTSGDWYTSLQGIANGIIDETTEYVTDKTMKAIDAVSREVKDKVAYITRRFESDVSGYAQNKLGEIIEDAERSLQYTLDELDGTLDRIINDAFNNLREGTGQRPNVEEYFNIEDDKLLGEIVDAIYNEYRDRIIEGSYSEVMSIKKEITQRFQSKIDAVKESIMYNVVREMGDITNRFETGVNDLMDKTATGYKDITKKHIDSIANKVKQSTNKKINGTLEDVVNKKGKVEKITALVPSFSYNDYLRLLLLIGIDDDVKLYRVLDLMQFNLQKNRKDNDLILHHYVTGYDVTAEVSVNYLFFRLPFMPDEAKGVEGNRYTFTINTSMSY